MKYKWKLRSSYDHHDPAPPESVLDLHPLSSGARRSGRGRAKALILVLILISV